MTDLKAVSILIALVALGAIPSTRAAVPASYDLNEDGSTLVVSEALPSTGRELSRLCDYLYDESGNRQRLSAESASSERDQQCATLEASRFAGLRIVNRRGT